MSQGKFDRGEEVLRTIAKANHRTFDSRYFEQLKREQIRVSLFGFFFIDINEMEI